MEIYSYICIRTCFTFRNKYYIMYFIIIFTFWFSIYRGEWIFGYGVHSLVGKSAKVLRHPGDAVDSKALDERKDYSKFEILN